MPFLLSLVTSALRPTTCRSCTEGIGVGSDSRRTKHSIECGSAIEPPDLFLDTVGPQ